VNGFCSAVSTAGSGHMRPIRNYTMAMNYESGATRRGHGLYSAGNCNNVLWISTKTLGYQWNLNTKQECQQLSRHVLVSGCLSAVITGTNPSRAGMYVGMFLLRLSFPGKILISVQIKFNMTIFAHCSDQQIGETDFFKLV
jgi:hypothetical protein